MTRVSDEDLEALHEEVHDGHMYSEQVAIWDAIRAELLALRKTWHIKRCDKWNNDGQDAADPARRCRLVEGHETDCDFGELERLRAENEKLRRVADAAVALEAAMAGIPCKCRDNSCEAMCKALREAGR